MTSLRGLCLAAACVLSSMVCAGAAQALAPPPPPPPTNDPAGIVVKIDRADGYSIADVAARFPLTVSSAVLASRGLYLVRSTDPKYAGDPKKTAALAGQISHSPGVVYAEPDLALQVADTQFHSWQYGSGTVAPSTAWSTQPAVTALGLPQAHQLTEGAGVVVAVLDTGEDLTQPALAGPTLAGWNYVDDNADTSDPANGTDSNHDGTADSAAGHGTFVAGMVRLVAPRATILPERVLDSDGNGNVFVVAQAIADAQAAGAKVINLSFGTAAKIDSKVLDDVLRQAQQAGVVVTVAAGNDASTMPHYPAARPGVLSVGALNASGSTLATFSDRGAWVQVAAPGSSLVGPIPGGRYVTWSGTSMAAPLAAGQAALLAAAAPQLTGSQLVAAVDLTGSRLLGTSTSHGAINVPASLQRVTQH